MELGVCYYPEHWPAEWWVEDARRMRELGIRWVRIAEFAWSLMEPEPGRYDWAWLDKAIDTLHRSGLKIVLCTPTATPPKWLVDADPTILAVDEQGRSRGFGSRRHYDFSSPAYRRHATRITRAIAERYGEHPGVAAWQTDNEYGCHLTVLSYSENARRAFRPWLARRYGTIDALNRAWGNVFWSMVYRSFDEVDLPMGAVTETNPSHRLDFRRFASDEVAAFNREQVSILRLHSPGRPVAHNFMGFFTEFDHRTLSRDLDIAAWDSYPLGFTQNFFLTPDEKQKWARSGHPDIPSFHHDLYRGMCRDGRWWVMEQQPGPVNWAQWNPAPHDGMVRLWTWQAFAHGAEVVSYFRWRQAPFAQEQMHAGLNRPDRSLDQGGIEAGMVGDELQQLAASAALAGPLKLRPSVALVFDYDAVWMSQIQPQGADYNPVELAFRVYSALRSRGLDVDIVGPDAPLDGYRLIVMPTQPHVAPKLAAALQSSHAQLVFGPRCGSKTETLTIPANLAPGPLAALAGVRVRRVSSLPPGCRETVTMPGADPGNAQITRWFEDLDLAGAEVEGATSDGRPAIARNGRARYVAGWLDNAGWRAVLTRAARDAGLQPHVLPDGIRVSRAGDVAFTFNFSDQTVAWQPSPDAHPLVGGASLPPRGVAIWKVAPST
ncbi:MAG TPA: beta-galactosidase [Burkholderiaceae bacterium]|nr:beta-galactosidase [Burkholderiaceae bacterium]